MFVFNTFRPSGLRLDWREILASKNREFVLQLKGLEYSLERAVTEFLLWNLIGYIESQGPSPLQCFIVLDEAIGCRSIAVPRSKSSCGREGNLASD